MRILLAALCSVSLFTSAAATALADRPPPAPSASAVAVPARFSWTEAQALERRFHPLPVAELHTRFERARSLGSAKTTSALAAELCTRGNWGRRACREAERRAGGLPHEVRLAAPSSVLSSAFR